MPFTAGSSDNVYHFTTIHVGSGVTVKLSDTPGSIRRPAPLHGEHTAEILAELAAARQAGGTP